MFLLISKLRKIYYVKRYDDNTVYLVYYHSTSNNNNNIYFNRVEDKIKFNTTGNHQQCGCFFNNNKIVEEHK